MPRSPINPFFVVILILTLAVPLIVLPNLLDNAFKTPKNLLMFVGVSVMVGLYCLHSLRGQTVLKPGTSTPKIILFLVFLNFFSLFYTSNYYFTLTASMMNITCLLFFSFVSLYVDEERAFTLVILVALGGLLVSIFAWLQFIDKCILFKWARPGDMIMGTIGNSNYLGAYLIFPLFAMAGLIFLMKGKIRFVPTVLLLFIMGAFLFARARAAWFGFFLSIPLFLYLLKRIHGISIFGHLRSHPKQAVIYGVVFLTILASLWSIAPQRLHRMMDPQRLAKSDTLMIRIKKYYRASYWLFKQNPLFGTGLWSYRNMVYKAQAEINKIDKDFFEDYPDPKPRRVHTDYLEVLNDGGLLAATALLLFFIVVMRHGWAVIKDEGIVSQDRIIAAICFSSVVATMLTAFFFFPLRINSTMFMTVLMMGLMESIYLKRYGHIRKSDGWRSEVRFILVPLIFLVLAGAIWFRGIKPFQGEMEHFKYKKALAEGHCKKAERSILRAIDHDPHNSSYCVFASQLYMNDLKEFGKARDFIERALIDYNGDITLWSIYFVKGLLKYHMGSVYEAKAAFEKSLYYNPTFEVAKQKLAEVKKVIKDHDRLLIKFR